MMGNLHKLTKNFSKKRKNSLDLNEWKRLFKKCEDADSNEDVRCRVTNISKEAASS